MGNNLPSAPPAPPPPPEASIATVRFSGLVKADNTGTTSQTTNVLLVTQVVINEPELANAVVVDSASAAAAIGRFRTVSSSAAAAAYWYYVAPTATFDLGTHRAFGDAPVGAAPTSGIAQYNYVGGTTPTDNYGRAGFFSGSNLTMNFGSQTVQNTLPITITFAPNAAMSTSTSYTIPGQTFSMGAGLQTLTGVTCAPCVGSTIGSVNGQFVGANRQGYAASVLVRNTQLTTVNTANAGGVVLVYAKQ